MRHLILYACGQFGWSLASYSVGNLLVYFYKPPATGEITFPTFLYQGAVLGVFTLVGILGASGRFLDAVIDPMVANRSDRSRSPLGKRRVFMLWSAVPFALTGFLAFWPPDQGESTWNFLWLAATVTIFYFSFACYVIPYNALMAELGRSPEERVRISTYVAVAWALGFMAGSTVYALQAAFKNAGFDPVSAFQSAVGILQALALVFLLLPAVFLDEKKYARQQESDHDLKTALKIVLGDRNFRHFLVSFMLYWLALTFIQLGVANYTALLFGLKEEMASGFLLLSFLSSFLLYWPINLMVKRMGKRRLLLNAFWAFGLIFMVLCAAKYLPGHKTALLYALGVAAAFPLAAFGIIPNAIVGDEVEKAEERGEGQLSGMFFGVTAFTMKVGVSLANLIFPSLLLFGNSKDQTAGVELTAAAALVFCLAGWWAFRRYKP